MSEEINMSDEEKWQEELEKRIAQIEQEEWKELVTMQKKDYVILGFLIGVGIVGLIIGAFII